MAPKIGPGKSNETRAFIVGIPRALATENEELSGVIALSPFESEDFAFGTSKGAATRPKLGQSLGSYSKPCFITLVMPLGKIKER